MLETSQDLFFIVVAIAILWLTIFLSTILYYFFIIARQGSKIIKEWKERFQKVDGIINLVKEKIEYSASSFVILTEGIKQILTFIKAKKQTAKKKNK